MPIIAPTQLVVGPTEVEEEETKVHHENRRLQAYQDLCERVMRTIVQPLSAIAPISAWRHVRRHQLSPACMHTLICL